MLDRIVRHNSARQRGNIIALACVTFSVICIVLVVAYSFCGLAFTHARLQASADEIALAGAKKLNDRDRIGQLNIMIVRCRQLVHSSSSDYESVQTALPQLGAVALDLLEESKTSALVLEKERLRMLRLAQQEANDEMLKRFNEIKPTYLMTLPWLKVDAPRLVQADLGRLSSVPSNVTVCTAFAELLETDRNNNSIAPSLNLYQGDKDLKLQEEPDLPFKVSSLPAPVETTIAPARIALAQNYRSKTEDFIPSAARVSLQLNVQTSLGFQTGSTMAALGTAGTTGAGLQ